MECVRDRRDACSTRKRIDAERVAHLSKRKAEAAEFRCQIIDGIVKACNEMCWEDFAHLVGEIVELMEDHQVKTIAAKVLVIVSKPAAEQTTTEATKV
jgi:hypothetical protein